MSIFLMQTERTYNVTINNRHYTVTVLEDPSSSYYQYDVFDNKGMEVEDEREELEVINYLESKID